MEKVQIIIRANTNGLVIICDFKIIENDTIKILS